ncbi:MAG: histidinol-phosphatase HisJ [Candidatus Anammoxibacter sp.]
MIDYHIHTKLCGHASGEMAEYVECAIAAGVKEMGFSDHLPMVINHGTGLAMSIEKLPLYVEEVLSLRSKYPEIDIKLGIEADYFPGLEEDCKKAIDQYPFDYVIGSVHFIKKWGFDNINQIDQWAEKNINQVYRDYYALLRKSAQSGLFDIIGHSDLVKKFGQKPSDDLTDEIEHTARVFGDNNLTCEINTSGLRRPVSEIYPSLNILKIYKKYNISIIFGSDAHSPNDVACDFDSAYLMAANAGYEDEAQFVMRKKKMVKRTFK